MVCQPVVAIAVCDYELSPLVLRGFRIMGCSLFISFGIVPAAHVKSPKRSASRGPHEPGSY